MQSIMTIMGRLSSLSNPEAIQMVQVASMSVYSDSSNDPSLHHRYKTEKLLDLEKSVPGLIPNPLPSRYMSVDLCLFCLSMVKETYSGATFPKL